MILFRKKPKKEFELTPFASVLYILSFLLLIGIAGGILALAKKEYSVAIILLLASLVILLALGINKRLKIEDNKIIISNFLIKKIINVKDIEKARIKNVSFALSETAVLEIYLKKEVIHFDLKTWYYGEKVNNFLKILKNKLGKKLEN